MSLLPEPPPAGPDLRVEGQKSNDGIASGEREIDATTKRSDLPPIIEEATGSSLADHADQEDIGENGKSDSEYDSEMEDMDTVEVHFK